MRTGRRVAARLVHLTPFEVGRHERVAGRRVGGIEVHRFGQGVDRLAGPVALEEFLGERLVALGRPGRVAHLGGGACRAHAGRQIARIERRDADQDLVRTGAVVAPAALVGDRRQAVLRLRQQTLLGIDLGRVQQRVLVVGPDLDGFPVEGKRLGEKPFGGEVVGDL